MFSTPTHSLDINTIAEDPVMIDFINKYFPDIYNNVYKNKSFSLIMFRFPLITPSL